jgi:hypothetical protein
MQAARDRPLCDDFDYHLIRIYWGLRERSVVDIRKTAVCGKTAKLIEPRRRRCFDLHAASRNLLHERCQCLVTAARFIRRLRVTALLDRVIERTRAGRQE